MDDNGTAGADVAKAAAGRRGAPFEEVERLDRELARLGRGSGATRLRLGEALEVIAAKGAHHELGFASLEAYALERCERNARFVVDSRVMARRLAALALVREALRGGRISWSMAELLARRATPETEAGLLAEALGSTVRKMRAGLAEAAQVEDDPERRRTIERNVAVEDMWAVVRTRMLLKAIHGVHGDDDLVEALVGEGLISLQNLTRDRLGGELVLDEAAEARRKAWYAQIAAWRAEAEADCEEDLKREEPVAIDVGPQAPLPADPKALDDVARNLSRELARRDLEMGDVARRLLEANGWRRLGYASEQQYVRERVGVSHAGLKARMTLSRRVETMPEIGEALKSGGIGFEAAQLVARVGTAETAAKWIAQARERTIKHLREEVAAVGMLERLQGAGPGFEPPTEDDMKRVEDIERRVLHPDGSQMSGTAQAAENPGGEAGQMSGKPGGEVPLRLHVREDLYEAWRALEDQYRRSGLPWSFVSFLCAAAWTAWEPTMQSDVAYKEIYERDLHRCRVPGCNRRDLTPHHLKYRSRGGGDEPENLASACVFCHLMGIHENRIRAEPPASRIRWTIGRQPILVVEGRRAWKDMERPAPWA